MENNNILVDEVIDQVRMKLLDDRMNRCHVNQYLLQRRVYLRTRLLHQSKEEVIQDMIRMYYEMIEMQEELQFIPKPYTTLSPLQCDSMCTLS